MCGVYEVQEDHSRHRVTPLWCAAVSNKLPIVGALLRYGAEINATSDTQSTPVRSACYMTNVDVVKFLIKHGADVHDDSAPVASRTSAAETEQERRRRAAIPSDRASRHLVEGAHAYWMHALTLRRRHADVDCRRRVLFVVSGRRRRSTSSRVRQSCQ